VAHTTKIQWYRHVTLIHASKAKLFISLPSASDITFISLLLTPYARYGSVRGWSDFGVTTV